MRQESIPSYPLRLRERTPAKISPISKYQYCQSRRCRFRFPLPLKDRGEIMKREEREIYWEGESSKKKIHICTLWKRLAVGDVLITFSFTFVLSFAIFVIIIVSHSIVIIILIILFSFIYLKHHYLSYKVRSNVAHKKTYPFFIPLLQFPPWL